MLCQSPAILLRFYWSVKSTRLRSTKVADGALSWELGALRPRPGLAAPNTMTRGELTRTVGSVDMPTGPASHCQGPPFSIS